MHYLPEALGFPGHLPQDLLKGIPIVFFPARYFSSIAANLSTGAEAATPSPCFRFPYPAADHNQLKEVPKHSAKGFGMTDTEATESDNQRIK